MSCKHCEKEKYNNPLVSRGSRTVNIEKANETTWGICMWWRTENGKWHMEWNSIDYCPKCGRKLGGDA